MEKQFVSVRLGVSWYSKGGGSRRDEVTDVKIRLTRPSFDRGMHMYHMYVYTTSLSSTYVHRNYLYVSTFISRNSITTSIYHKTFPSRVEIVWVHQQFHCHHCHNNCHHHETLTFQWAVVTNDCSILLYGLAVVGIPGSGTRNSRGDCGEGFHPVGCRFQRPSRRRLDSLESR